MERQVTEWMGRLERRHARWKQRPLGRLVAPALIALGVVMLAAGIFMLAFPGPGWLFIFLAVTVLSLEVGWIREHLLFGGARTYDRAYAWIDSKGTPAKVALVVLTCVSTTTVVVGSWYLLSR